MGFGSFVVGVAVGGLVLGGNKCNHSQSTYSDQRIERIIGEFNAYLNMQEYKKCENLWNKEWALPRTPETTISLMWLKIALYTRQNLWVKAYTWVVRNINENYIENFLRDIIITLRDDSDVPPPIKLRHFKKFKEIYNVKEWNLDNLIKITSKKADIYICKSLLDSNEKSSFIISEIYRLNCMDELLFDENYEDSVRKHAKIAFNTMFKENPFSECKERDEKTCNLLNNILPTYKTMLKIGNIARVSETDNYKECEKIIKKIVGTISACKYEINLEKYNKILNSRNKNPIGINERISYIEYLEKELLPIAKELGSNFLKSCENTITMNKNTLKDLQKKYDLFIDECIRIALQKHHPEAYVNKSTLKKLLGFAKEVVDSREIDGTDESSEKYDEYRCVCIGELFIITKRDTLFFGKLKRRKVVLR